MRLYQTLRAPVLLESLETDGSRVFLHTTSWEDYWKVVPSRFGMVVARLKQTWDAYVASRFALSHASEYCRAYFELLGMAREPDDESGAILPRVLGFENFVLRRTGSADAFAAATASFRSPAFLSFVCRGLRKHSRNDPSLLPLLAAFDGPDLRLFYHYRKQRLLKNCDECLLVFPSVELEKRGASFQGFDELTHVLLEPWDSRIEQRSRLMGGKILASHIAASNRVDADQTALRILDIGSGVGLFTSRLLSEVAGSGCLGSRKVELSLLDILSIDPKRHFQSPRHLSSVSKVEYVSQDYAAWLQTAPAQSGPMYDLAFLFRILHNFSTFRIEVQPKDDSDEARQCRRYAVHEHMSTYYAVMSAIFPAVASSPTPLPGSLHFPNRVFNHNCLRLPDGSSLLDRLTKLCRVAIIEDGDLAPSDIVNHLRE